MLKCWIAVVAFAACDEAPPAPAPVLPAPQAKLMGAVARGFTAKTIAMRPRSHREWESDVDGVVYDAALDCVANQIHELSDPDRYTAVATCGSPLVVNDVRRVDKAEVAKTISELRDAVAEGTPLHIGSAVDGEYVAIVTAPAELELEPYHAGDRELRGRYIGGETLSVETSSGAGVTNESLTINAADGKFAIDISSRTDADLEILGNDSISNRNQVFARFRIGEGSPLFAVRGTLFERANAARARVGLAPLQTAPGLGECDAIPPQIAGIDLTDVGSCEQIQSTWSEVLSRQIAYSPSFQEALLTRRAAVLEYGSSNNKTAGYRLMSRFETLSATAQHSIVMTKLRDRWPNISERALPHDALEIAALAAGTPPSALPHTLTAKLQKLGNSWSVTKHSYVTIVAARDLQSAVNRLAPDDVPEEAAIATSQVRGSDGAMYQVIAVALSQP